MRALLTALLTALFDWQSSKGGAGGDGAADAWRLFNDNFKVRSRARARACVCSILLLSPLDIILPALPRSRCTACTPAAGWAPDCCCWPTTRWTSCKWRVCRACRTCPSRGRSRAERGVGGGGASKNREPRARAESTLELEQAEPRATILVIRFFLNHINLRIEGPFSRIGNTW